MLDRVATNPAAARDALVKHFPEAAARPASVRLVRAPGRVNLIGEHTDYNEGLVLPMAIDREIAIAFIPSSDRVVHLARADTGEEAGFELDAIGQPRGTWIDYVAGVAWSLAADGLQLRGLRGVVSSTLPIAAGLSSSAALELAAAMALLQTGEELGRLRLARLAQRAETEYVGVQCGLMDQLTASLGSPGGALLIDCRRLSWSAVGLPLDRIAVIAVDSGSPRRLEASQYNARRVECQTAVKTLSRADPSIRSLRDLTAAKLSRVGFLLDPLLRRRAEHVVHENERVAATVEALRLGDLATIGRLFAESHASLRDLYEVSSPELDALVDIAASLPGVIGSRMTGAGFGGCTVNLVARGQIHALQHAVETDYPRRTGLRARVLRVEPNMGAAYRHL